jgi:hypothetical protein
MDLKAPKHVFLAALDIQDANVVIANSTLEHLTKRYPDDSL